jgi:hypothetical protein
MTAGLLDRQRDLAGVDLPDHPRYKVGVFADNPGERLSDETRAATFARSLNEQARQGWEPVGSVLSRDGVQTVGGAVTTRETTSFVAFRRKR